MFEDRLAHLENEMRDAMKEVLQTPDKEGKYQKERSTKQQGQPSNIRLRSLATDAYDVEKTTQLYDLS